MDVTIEKPTSQLLPQDHNRNSHFGVEGNETDRKRLKVDGQGCIPLVALTKSLLQTYRKCSSEKFRYQKVLQNPKRALTKDPVPNGNMGYDNKNGDIILNVGDIIVNPVTGQSFKVLDMLGQGTFGQVVKCKVLNRKSAGHETMTSIPGSVTMSSSAPRSSGGGSSGRSFLLNNNNNNNNNIDDTVMMVGNNNNSSNITPPPNSSRMLVSDSIGKRSNSLPCVVAIKIVKNRPAYTNQAKVEIKILEKLSRAHEKADPYSKPFHDRIVDMIDSFIFHSHTCVVFELMSINLFELIKQREFRGLPIRDVASFATQILAAMKVLSDLEIVHCDIKPENILIENFSNPARLKLIDFGSACFENNTLYTYIQSRFYRAPEIIIGLPYNKAIDVWSFGCIVAELFMGLPIFPGISNHNQLARMEEIVGEFPEWMLVSGKQTKKFFTRTLVPAASDQDSTPSPTTDNRGSIDFESYGGIIVSATDENLDSLLGASVPSSSTSGGGRGDACHEEQMVHKWVLKTPEEWAYDENLRAPEKMKRYFRERSIKEIAMNCDPKRRPVGETCSDIDKNVLSSFYSFLKALLIIDPNKRMTVEEAIAHPFVASPSMVGMAPLHRLSSLMSNSLPGSPLSPYHGGNSGSFYGNPTPFSPPLRPGVPYPFGHDWSSASNNNLMEHAGSFSEGFYDPIGSLSQLSPNWGPENLAINQQIPWIHSSLPANAQLDQSNPLFGIANSSRERSMSTQQSQAGRTVLETLNQQQQQQQEEGYQDNQMIDDSAGGGGGQQQFYRQPQFNNMNPPSTLSATSSSFSLRLSQAAGGGATFAPAPMKYVNIPNNSSNRIMSRSSPNRFTPRSSSISEETDSSSTATRFSFPSTGSPTTTTTIDHRRLSNFGNTFMTGIGSGSNYSLNSQMEMETASSSSTILPQALDGCKSPRYALPRLSGGFSSTTKKGAVVKSPAHATMNISPPLLPDIAFHIDGNVRLPSVLTSPARQSSITTKLSAFSRVNNNNQQFGSPTMQSLRPKRSESIGSQSDAPLFSNGGSGGMMMTMMMDGNPQMANVPHVENTLADWRPFNNNHNNTSSSSIQTTAIDVDAAKSASTTAITDSGDSSSMPSDV